VDTPVRFNMPFELGIAFTLGRIGGTHKIVLLEARRYRLQKTLSDLNGIDPGIHEGTVKGIISCVLSSLAKPAANPDPTAVKRVYDQLHKVIRVLKRNHNRKTVYSRAIFQELVSGAARLARKEGLITS
jgi:hypothetical protein